MVDMRRGLIFSSLVVFFLLLSSACQGGAREVVVIAGSTSVEPIVGLLAEEYEQTGVPYAVDVLGGGSSAGIRAAEAGTAHIGMSSRPLRGDTSPPETDLWHIEIARDGLAIIVHPDNPVNDITLEQLLAVYTGEVTNWNELGGNDARIHVIAREEGSGTRGAFEEMVMGGKRITPRAIVQNTNGSVRQLVSNDKHAMGFVSFGLVDEEQLIFDRAVKALSINGVAAIPENIDDESYELFRSFWLVSAQEPQGAAMDFINFVTGEAGRHILQLEGLVPPPVAH